MTASTSTATALSRAHATGPASSVATSIITDLRAGLPGHNPSVVLWFASSRYDPMELAGELAGAFPAASVIGCSTAGELTDRVSSTGGVAAVALGSGVVGRHAAALGALDGDPATGTRDAVAAVESRLGAALRSLDPQRWLGLVLIDGMHGAEETVNAQLGNAAPLLQIVGGSAGDDLAFERTWVAVGDEVSWNGVALVVAEATVAFEVVKTCSFTPMGRTFRVTRADAVQRIVWELDGRPAVDAYADALGIAAASFGSEAFMEHPVGLMVGDEPFIRSPQRVVDGAGIAFYCEVLEGADVELMRSTDLVADTGAALARARDNLGGAAGAVLFNCVLRRLELDAKGLVPAFLDHLGGIPSAGFHTYGETWLGHINQTLTGVVFGPPAPRP